MGWEFRLNEVFGCGWIGEAGAGVKQKYGSGACGNAEKLGSSTNWYYITTKIAAVMAGLVPAIQAEQDRQSGVGGCI